MIATARGSLARVTALALILVLAAAAGAAVGNTLRSFVRLPDSAAITAPSDLPVEYPDYAIRHPAIADGDRPTLTRPEIR